MGWPEQQALSSDVNAILVAHEGRLGMFEAVGWVERAPGAVKDSQPSGREMTPELFDAVFG